MKSRHSLFSYFILLFFTLQNTSNTFALLCPPFEQTEPCFCDEVFNRLDCMGPDVTQDVINNFFAILRPLNGIHEGEWMEIPYVKFTLVQSTMTTLDLTPFFYNQLGNMYLEHDESLHTIYSSTDIPGQGQISITGLFTSYTPLTDIGLNNTFKYFDPLRLKTLWFDASAIQGGQYEIGDGSGDIEFLPGFSTFTHLEELRFASFDITYLGGGQFKRNVRLRDFSINIGRLSEIGEHAFLLDPCPENEECPQGFGYIGMTSNKLMTDSFHPNHGLDSWKWGIELMLDSNLIDSLPEEIWSKYLYAHPSNELSVGYTNKFFCTTQMQWLRDGIAELEGRVHKVVCENDPTGMPNFFWSDFELPEPSPVKCPLKETVAPCRCSSASTSVLCEGEDVTQQVVNNLFSSIRSVNNMADNTMFDMYKFTMERSALTSFDISPLFYTRINRILIGTNRQLEKVEGIPLNASSSNWFIDTSYLNLRWNVLTDEGLGSTLALFSPASMVEIDMSANFLQGGRHVIQDGSGDIEMFQGLGGLVNLQSLTLDSGKMTSLGGGQLKRNVKLNYLNIGYNEMTGWGEGAFDTQENGHPNDRVLNIYSRNNYLNNDGIHPNHGLDKWPGQVVLYLEENQFEFLSQEVWENFLVANNHTNIAEFSTHTNYLVCDQRMKWLKDGREDYEHRMLDLWCSNDPGKSAFTSDLV